MMLLIDQALSDHHDDEHANDVREGLLEANEQLNNINYSKSLAHKDDVQPNNTNTRSMSNLDDASKQHLQHNIVRNVFKHSMMLKSFRKQEYNQYVSNMLDKRKSFIMSVGERIQPKEVQGSGLDSIPEEKHAHDNSKTAAIILAAGLLLHNIFEGMSVGLSRDMGQLAVIMVAVCSHKVITSFSLGLSFHQAKW